MESTAGERDALMARLAGLPADELLEVWESLTAVVVHRATENASSLTSTPQGGDSIDGRLDAMLAERREFEQAAQVAQRVSRRADAALHLIAGAHHESVKSYDELSGASIGETRAYSVEAGEFAAASLGASLAISTPAARGMADTARSLRRRHPSLLAATVAGDGAMRVAGMLAGELDHLDDDDATHVESALVAGGVHRRSHQAARERCRTILRQMGLARAIDPIAADRERGVWFEPHLDFDNLCRMTAVLDAHDAAALRAVIGARARQLWENSSRDRGLRAPQARADALVDLVLENSSVTVTLNLTVSVMPSAVDAVMPPVVGVVDTSVPDSTSDAPARRAKALHARATGPSGATDAVFQPCAVPGVGIIPAELVARLATQAGAGFTATLTCADSGRVTTLAATTQAYRPTVGIAKLVRERDGVCRFPYCTASAAHADLDHVVPFDQGGPTTATNLQALCRHHHRAKTHGGFTVTMTAEGDCTWVSPTGWRWVTQPGGVTHAVSVPVCAA